MSVRVSLQYERFDTQNGALATVATFYVTFRDVGA